MSRSIWVLGFWLCCYSSLLAQEPPIRNWRQIAIDAEADYYEQLDALVNLSGYYLRRSPDSSLFFARKLKTLAQFLGETNAEAFAHNQLGNNFNNAGSFDSALYHFSQAQELFLSIDDLNGETGVRMNMGLLHQRKGDFESALEQYLPGLEILTQLGDSVGMAGTYINIGSVYFYQGDFPNALAYLTKGIEICDLIGHLHFKANGIINLGLLYKEMKDYDQALSYYQVGAELTRELGIRASLANTLSNMASLEHRKNRHEEALALYQEGLEIYREIGDQSGISTALSNIGGQYEALEELEQALQSYQEALRIARDIGAKPEHIHALSKIGNYFVSRGQPAQALPYYENAARLVDEDSYNTFTREVHKGLYFAYKALGQNQKALVAHERFIAIRDSLSSETNQRATIRFQYQQEALQDSLNFEAQQSASELSFQKELAQRNYWLFGVLSTSVILALIAYFWVQRRNRQKELGLERERREKLEKIDQLKDQFLANTSHELRTPLNGIIGISESLYQQAEETNPATLRENLAMTISAGKRLASLVNDILDFSKLKSQEIALRLKPVHLPSMVDLVLRIHQPLVAGKELSLENQLDPQMPMLEADEDRLQQILFNLIGNATKFTESGFVRVSAQLTPDQAIISIQDSGIGIPEAKQALIFQAFEQGDGSTQRAYAGTGLGLSISKQLVELHGGSLWVESIEGQGSTFFFSLPLSALDLASPEKPEPGLPSFALASPIASQSIPAIALQALGGEWGKVLVVDDEPINQQVIKNHLKDGGHQLTQVMNGQEALRLIRQGEKYDLVLLDVMMPSMSGYEVCEEIRKLYLPSELPVIMVTAKNQVADLVQGLHLGANDYLAKPFSREEFLARVNTHLNLRQINQVTHRFVPSEFIRSLGRDTLSEVKLGDQVQREVSVMFSDIRDYTSLSETMTPEENFRFVNAYVGRMGPLIKENHGFVNQYLGDGIMAIFQHHSDHGLAAALGMQHALQAYNLERKEQQRSALRVGIGLHTGPLIMGIIGDQDRTDAATISDTVNTASRMESLTKELKADILLSQQSVEALQHPQDFGLRYLGRVLVKGKKVPVGVYECFDADTEEIRNLKRQGLSEFDHALKLYQERSFQAAIDVWSPLQKACPMDQVTSYFIECARYYLQHAPSQDWIA